MKPIAILCLLPVVFYSQMKERRTGNTQLQTEWKHELSIPGTPEIVTDIILSDELIFTSLRGENGSRLLIYYPEGTEKSVFQENSFIQNLQMLNKHLYSMGGCQLITRSADGIIDFETCLKLQENWTLSAVDGEIMGSGAYALHWAKMLAAYDLNGQMKWSNQIGELSDNKFLKTGGGKIYVFANISNPNLGSRLMQYDTLGNQKWSVPVGKVNNILADKNGNCYVFSLVPQKSNIVSKYDSEGKLLWSREVTDQTVGNGYLHGDSLLVCGIETIEAANGNMQNPAFSILAVGDGKVLYQQKLDFYPSEESAEAFTHIATDGKVIYIGGQTGGQYARNFLVKLSRDGNTTGLKEATGSGSFNIFPNPGGSKFTISCDNSRSESLKVTVRNSLGQVVQKKEIECEGQKSWELDLGKQLAGNYTIEIVSGKDKVVKKILVE